MARIFGNESGHVRRMKFGFRVRMLVLFAIFSVALYAFAKDSSSLFSSDPLTVGVSIIVFLGVAKIISFLFKRQDRGLHKAGRGLKGEAEVAEALEALPESYRVYRGVKLRKGGDIDFVVAGPNGVCTVEVKSHRGRVDFNGRELTLNGTPFRDKNVLHQAFGEAMNLHHYLRERMQKDIFVTPLIVFSDAEAFLHFGMNPVYNVYVIQKDLLRECITGLRESVFSLEEIHALLLPCV
ncbi:hypothetical protein A3J43_01755 [Candidatus Uhrbacteria bacterium RIFCSPHIGHO2_12_FULL_54_23]|uniref:NERD domain-containing protein n=1 Tax=Candidatus Uhrbacteria bacterium RIFCSPHIGHO2_12_FULL_54_23 TaxID=1802397 RepID=A0A1F7UIS8_9BACT|nr:MAG: hypothetical protein A3J43_01755 [Candidatus Uhrbacteria bacterium RIFCSPHIGHO2_12_FULL_54_23]